MTKFLVTGSAGFIGYHLSERLLRDGHEVVGIDNFSPYYDVVLKQRRSERLSAYAGFDLVNTDISDAHAVASVFDRDAPEVVVHLAAQAGVRYSIDHPEAYISSNIIGTFNLLEQARQKGVKHFLAASTSSVYGANTEMPFTELQRTSTPLTLYAATKSGTEQMAHCYSHLFDIPMTFFRFFNVYGTWGRPDLALFKFTKAMLAGEPIDVYNHGDMKRDFTYVDDLVEAVVRLTVVVPGDSPVANDSLSPVAPYRVVNIGRGKPYPLMDYIQALENALGMQAEKNFMPMQTGDVYATEASADLLKTLTGYVPKTPLSVGVPAFVEWYFDYFGVERPSRASD